MRRRHQADPLLDGVDNPTDVTGPAGHAGPGWAAGSALAPDPGLPAHSPGVAIHAAIPPTMEAALARLAAVQPSTYARTRNAIEGAVTGLSPYITHGLLSLRQVVAEVNARHPLDVQHKLVYELGWRAFFRHVWQHRGEEILQSLHAGPLPEAAYQRELPDDIRQARTGVPVIDRAVQTLYATGTLHNHARMWLASYVVHLRKVHWRAGADWLYGHLLDGDLASNHLSWQWVAGTGSSKPYVFNAENVARYAPADWHSFGSIVDMSYAALDAWARSASRRAGPASSAGLGAAGIGMDAGPGRGGAEVGVEEPSLRRAPGPAVGATSADAAWIAGKTVWLVHPWSLGPLPADLPPDTAVVGLYLKEFHEAWPWSDARWTFVDQRMAALTPIRWWTDAVSLGQVLHEAAAVRVRWDPHLRPWVRSLSEAAPLQELPQAPLFPDVPVRCDSFSQWWRRAVKGLQTADDLLAQQPGIGA